MSSNETRQRLILLFDGTWNDHHRETNVYRMARSIHDFDGSIPQRFFYDPGVGTSKFEKYRGGLLGYGLSENLREGYEWLARRYREGDEIFIFGFSRGAYTARSLAGMIRKCGLVDIVTPGLIADVEAMYRDEHGPDDEKCVDFRSKYAKEPKIRMIGVWDTVGALGIPHTVFSERGKYKFHDTRLSRIVEHAYQALALDEHRGLYDAVLWTGEQKPGQKVEQLWFIGAHANVGGGYPEDPLAKNDPQAKTDPLAKISLEWMQRKAAGAGLKVDFEHVPDEAYKKAPNDSFAEMFMGGYALASKLLNPGDGRHYRFYGRNAASSKHGDGNPTEQAVNVGIHPTVWQRMIEDKNYRPKTLRDARMVPEAGEMT